MTWPRTAVAELYQSTLICAKPSCNCAPILLEPAARSLRLSAVVRCGPSPLCAGLPELIAPLALRVVRRILAAGRLLRERRGWCIALAARCGMCSYLQVIGPC